MHKQSDVSLDICFEDQHLLVVNKPSGVLSQPGKTVDGSIASQVRDAYPNATGPLLVHRLDMDTSGLMVLAKNRTTHRALQQQFENRQIGKEYVAVVSQAIDAQGGIIELPVRLDIDNRPVQVVCREFGKTARTLWRLLEKNLQEHSTRILFTPISGRTHQLRVHAAHKGGLNAPIIGDRLYGESKNRLLLHAQQLIFTHPVTQKRKTIFCEAPF